MKCQQLVDMFIHLSNQYSDKFVVNEWHIYGSSRIGTQKIDRQLVQVVFNGTWNSYEGNFGTETNQQVTFYQPDIFRTALARGNKRYELTNHLGNVLVVISDKKLPYCTEGTADYYTAEVLQATDYSAFGVILEDREYYATTTDKYRYGFNGKENDNEISGIGNGQDFSARMYDNRLGRWKSVDPKAHDIPSWSTYSAMFCNPIIYIDPDGAFPYPIHIRSFAPYKTFGGWFHGDDRGWSTALGKGEGGSVTSRMQHTFTVDPNKALLTNNFAWCNESSHPIFGSETGKTRATINNFKSTKDAAGNNTTTFSSVMAANLPLIPSADIDVTTNFSLTENLKAGTLDITVIQIGDRFPAAETFIGDTKGNQLFIGVSPAVGGPYTSLPMNRKESMMSANFTVTLDKDGVFTGVKQGDRTYTIGEWNKIMQAIPLEIKRENTVIK